MIFLKLLRESFLFAYDALRQNKLRTMLSLLGVTIGIFTIITVRSAVDTLRNNLQESVNKLGNNSIYIQKWPWIFDGDFPWWKYMQRPVPTLREYDQLQKRSTLAFGISYEIAFSSRTIKYKSNTIEGTYINAVMQDHDKVWNFDLAQGRYFTDIESKTGAPVAIIGFDIAQHLFPDGTAVGKQLKVMGRYVNIIGVFSKEGDDMLGNSDDKNVLIPINFAKDVIDVQNENYQPQIVVRGKDGVSDDELESELHMLMRSIRRLKPNADDNFSLNKTTMLSDQLSKVFSVLDIGGIIIGGFSVLVGGFGIANIMFVSVKERTNIIGIQKSLGAKNYFILLQFMIESVILCLVGGIIGLSFVFLGTLAIKGMFDVKVVLGASNIIRGMSISIIIGLLSGIIPAYSASRLNPVEAIRSN
ncbi:putative ABC transport system permease protein [Mucilaginibacter mallensis]|uniref:Putative ABC transport system permease protein n=1 Tax=Mucilaginibacter mallensis TaxID=652787 RepID=A0A1H1Z5D3_MUCMA|nr:ABC transporter permease [Mucilaginibacter mallensis]SDT28803.1 putative ABC transport system permease protein [Mucilaginibacter mallensis]